MSVNGRIENINHNPFFIFASRIIAWAACALLAWLVNQVNIMNLELVRQGERYAAMVAIQSVLSERIRSLEEWRIEKHH